MRPDCSPNPSRLSVAAGIWGENVVWCDSAAVLYNSVVNVDGKRASLLALSIVLSCGLKP